MMQELELLCHADGYVYSKFSQNQFCVHIAAWSSWKEKNNQGEGGKIQNSYTKAQWFNQCPNKEL